MEKEIEKIVGQFLNKHRDLVNNFEFTRLYDKIEYEIDSSDARNQTTTALTSLFTEIGIDPLKYMYSVPKHYMGGNKQIKKIDIPNNIVEICYRAFGQCYQLEEVKFPNTLKFIRSYTFIETGLKNIYFPDSVEIIGRKAFSYIPNLTSISVGKNIAELGIAPFELCNKLESMEFRGTKEEFNNSIWGKDKDIWDECKIRLIHCSDGDLNVVDKGKGWVIK